MKEIAGLFARLTSDLATVRPEYSDQVLCPLCVRPFGRAAIADIGDDGLSLEHIIPRALGGTYFTLSCRRCNNRHGSALDAHLVLSSDGNAGRLVQLPRATADCGVQSIASISVTGMPFSPRQVTVLIAPEIVEYTFNFSQSEWLDALDLGLPPIDNGSCLFLMAESPVATPDTPYGIVGRIEIYQQ